MNQPNPLVFGNVLQGAEPIPFQLPALDAFVLVGLLQAVWTDPNLSKYQHAVRLSRELSDYFQEKLGAIDPAIAEFIESGWETTIPPADDRKVVELHNAFAVYEFNEHGEPMETPELNLSRPVDWGNPQRWHYYFCKIELDIGRTHYVHHCHVWHQVDRHAIAAFQMVAGVLMTMPEPGSFPELCGRDYLDIEDDWEESWGDRPPLFQPPEDALYEDPVVLFDEVAGPIRDSELRRIVEQVQQLQQQQSL